MGLGTRAGNERLINIQWKHRERENWIGNMEPGKTDQGKSEKLSQELKVTEHRMQVAESRSKPRIVWLGSLALSVLCHHLPVRADHAPGILISDYVYLLWKIASSEKESVWSDLGGAGKPCLWDSLSKANLLKSWGGPRKEIRKMLYIFVHVLPT